MVMDEAIGDAIAEGHQAAFEDLINHYHKPILSYLERLLHDPEKAEDIVQETFLKFLLQLKVKQTPENVQAWLYKVATNLCRDYWRSASYRKERDLLSRLPEKRDRQAQVAEVYDHFETRMEIIKLLDELPKTQRDIVILRFYNDLKLHEVAVVMACPVGTIKSRLFHALRFLKSRIEENGGVDDGSFYSIGRRR